MQRFTDLQKLTSLRLIIYKNDLVQYERFSPLKLVRSLHLALYPLAADDFFKAIPPVFPNLERLTIECHDKNLLAELRARLTTFSPFPKLLHHNLYYQRELCYYFSGHDFAQRYHEHLQEHLGFLVDLL